MVSTDRSGTPIGMSWYVPGAWRPPPTRPPYSQILFKSTLHYVLNISCKFHSCVKTLSYKTTEPISYPYITMSVDLENFRLGQS